MIGQRFNKWLVLEYSGKSYYKCKCDCGTIKNVRIDGLKNGRSTSCGCYTQINEARYLYNNYKYHAELRNLDFKLEFDEFLRLTQSNCHYCNQEPRQRTRGTQPFIYNGIDRVENSIGYFKTNVVSCCLTCNRAKNKMTYLEFISWIKKIKLEGIKEYLKQYACVGNACEL